MKAFAKKRFGQHFLRDTGILNRIVQVMRPSSDDLVIEVGAGDGALSRIIAPSVQILLAIEIDRDRISCLEEVLFPFPQACVIQGDILALDLRRLCAPYFQQMQRLRVIGNLPYNIATAVIERFCHINLSIEDMLFMVQLEVAERIVAQPGSRKFGFLSVSCQHYCDAQIHFKVPPACFVPRPKVNSAVISLRLKKKSAYSSMEECFDEIVKAAFAHRRKTLLNSLKRHARIGLVAEDLLHSAGISGNRRAEDLCVADYESLAAELQGCAVLAPKDERQRGTFRQSSENSSGT